MADQDRNSGKNDGRREGWRKETPGSRDSNSAGGERRGFNRREPGSPDGPRKDSEGTARRGSGGYSRDSGERRGQDARPERGQRNDSGSTERRSQAGNRGGSWQDRPSRTGEGGPQRNDDRSQGRGYRSGGGSERSGGRRDSNDFSRGSGGAAGQRREPGVGERRKPREGGDRWDHSSDRGRDRDSRPQSTGDERRPYRGNDAGGSARPERSGQRHDGPARGGSSYGRDTGARKFGDEFRGGERRTSDRSRRPERSSSENGPADAPFSRPHNARDLRSANRPDRERSPEIDEDVTGSELDKVTRAQIRNLEERSALWVGKHLVMAGRLIEDDPELAFQHALAASRRGGRLAVVREAVGLTAYAAGHYGEALREFRTYRRISGSNDHLPVMADCERGLGRPDRALDLARSEDATTLDAAGKVELAIVVSGARTDLGQLEAAVAALEIPQLTKNRAFSYSPRLFRAYADALEAAGRAEDAASWRRQAEIAENALGVGAFADPDIIDLTGDDEEAELDHRAAAGTVQSIAAGTPDDGVTPPVAEGSPATEEQVSGEQATETPEEETPGMLNGADEPEQRDSE
ncbi:tetratricopeptide (TPR) repeat protein [Arthrobacter pigmenti]|uniref:Tetratricopeptide (TPR) repeat protein n=1 Tax=Arthrobacter pigmenti TaxID=271432 RepID=A0A846RUR5_9MICC|nr:hypothetical protein [Arthrobacter pigmenti]NJC22011.1 tetratricopeptide (TPR) repeat protein [Arthrobacter pigmenti]